MNEGKAESWQDHLDGALSEAEEKLRGATRPPDKLFHFTDANGAARIIETRSVLASSAICLNDGSELRHGMKVARDTLGARPRPEDERIAKLRGIWEKKISYYLDDQAEPPPENVFVASFCERADQLLHWLHYGRGGDGYAIEIRSNALEAERATPIHGGRAFLLSRVEYDRDRQMSAFAKVFDVYEALATRVDPARWGEGFTLELSAAAILLTFAMRMKDARFAPEDEWRITYVHSGPPRGPMRTDRPQVESRAVQNRIVPFVRRKLLGDGCPFTSVVYGGRVDGRVAKSSLRCLLRLAGDAKDDVTIGPSKIPLQ
jgi:hypothetical protein